MKNVYLYHRCIGFDCRVRACPRSLDESMENGPGTRRAGGTIGIRAHSPGRLDRDIACDTCEADGNCRCRGTNLASLHKSLEGTHGDGLGALRPARQYLDPYARRMLSGGRLLAGQGREFCPSIRCSGTNRGVSDRRRQPGKGPSRRSCGFTGRGMGPLDGPRPESTLGFRCRADALEALHREGHRRSRG